MDKEIAKQYLSLKYEDTFDFGKSMARSLKGGELIALYGDLGAGKTALTQGIAAGLGIKDKVNSPTFSIIKVYKVKEKIIKQLVHIDAYRLKSAKELVDIGVYDYLRQKNTVTVIEWPEIVASILISGDIEIVIKVEADKRHIKTQNK